MVSSQNMPACIFCCVNCVFPSFLCVQNLVNKDLGFCEHAVNGISVGVLAGSKHSRVDLYN